MRVLPAVLVLAALFGRVTDITTGQPLAHVKVAIGSHTTFTDARGHYRLSGLAAGRQTVTFSSSDVLPRRASVTVGAGSPTQFDMQVCSTTLDYDCGGASPGGL